MRSKLLPVVLLNTALGLLAIAPPTYPRPVSTTSVGIYDNHFLPRTHYVSAGTTVEWKNYGFHYHTVSSSLGLFDSGQLGHGQVFGYTFDRPGTYVYFCQMHPKKMQGAIVVMPDHGAGTDHGASVQR